MMNKKLVGTTLVGLMVAGFGAQASAIQTIDGMKGQNSADVLVNGKLGDQDNENPNEEIPDGDDKWIKVSLPIETAFFAKSGATKDADIIYTPDSMEQKIENHSGRPVKVMLEKYTLAESTSNPAITKLNLRNADSGVETEIAKTGLAVDFTNEAVEFAKLEKATKNGTKDKVNFDFTGLSNPNLVAKDSKGEVSGTLGFKFISLDKEGNEVPPKNETGE